MRTRPTPPRTPRARPARVETASGAPEVCVERRSCRSGVGGLGVVAVQGEAEFASGEAESGQVTVGSCARKGGACCAAARASVVTTWRSQVVDDPPVAAPAVAWCFGRPLVFCPISPR